MSVTGIRNDVYNPNLVKTKNDHVGNEALNFSDVLKSYEEKNKITADSLKDTDDWRNVSDDAWDKLLERIDDYIDSCKEMNREMVKRQQEAVQKASSEAPVGMKSIAASQAALAVASCGFFGGIPSGTEESDSETDWTQRLSTDDQVVLRNAKIAQDAEMSVINSIEEIKTGKISEYESIETTTVIVRREDEE